MIQLKAKIDIDNSNTQLDSVEVYNLATKNNVSNDLPPINEVKQGTNAWIIGYSKIGDDASLNDNVKNGGQIDYYISDKLAYNGYFYDAMDDRDYPFEVTISSSNPIKLLDITFDTIKNIYPQSITIGTLENYSSITVNNNKARFIYKLANPDRKIKLGFQNLNVLKNNTFYPMIIQGIKVGLSVDIDRGNLLNMQINHKDRADNEMPSFGIISNNGNISFIDSDNNIIELIEQDFLTTNQDVVITLEDTLSENKKVVGKYLTDKWNYDNNNKEVSVELRENLLQLQDILLNDIPLDYSIDNMAKMLEVLIKKIPNIDILYNTPAYSYLANIAIKYPYMDKGNLWNELQKICNVCGLHIYKDNEGELIIGYDYNV